MTKIFLEKTKLPIKLFCKIISLDELPRLPVIFYNTIKELVIIWLGFMINEFFLQRRTMTLFVWLTCSPTEILRVAL